MRSFVIVALGTALAGCASSSAEISATYVSPVMYQSYTCQQLAMEAQAVTTRAGAVSGAQDQKRSNDALATAAAVVVFWPAAFFVGGNGQTAAELGSGLIDQSQKMTVAAMQMADMKVWAHRS